MGERVVRMRRIHDAGFYEIFLPQSPGRYRLRIALASGEVQDFDDKPKSKDMGKVEVVEVQKIEDMPDDPLDGLELFLPDGSVYGSYNTAQEWTDTYCAMIRRIKGSQKLSDEVKDKKVKDFIHANDSVRKGLPPAMKIETSRVISEKNVEHKTVAPKDLPQVEEANVIES